MSGTIFSFDCGKHSQHILTCRGKNAIIGTIFKVEVYVMKHIKTIKTRNLCASQKNGGCGECQTSCQSACKTSCGIANQPCENKENEEK